MLADNESGGLHLELAFFFLTTKHTQKKKEGKVRKYILKWENYAEKNKKHLG